MYNMYHFEGSGQWSMGACMMAPFRLMNAAWWVGVQSNFTS